ncbi:hypothetical protein [Cysteiniphilum sp. JM-1]|uniref:hypothetical protein n=1 Tax=Cysteiniphilum sp. JM-1 TaxID=2610891 RepID=UPI001245DB1B|nr:hypothetical protein [Cysteiniphilum sp. JM-1]
MSQYQFITTNDNQKNVKVLMGWDRPLQYHYLVIEHNQKYLYSNLDDDHFPKDLNYFYAKLNQFGINPPDSLYQKLLHDEAVNRGNHFEDYGNV